MSLTSSVGRTALVYVLGVAAMIAAMTWVTARVLVLERAEHEARDRSRTQESVRLALWRMDSMMTAILAREAARPYYHYQPFFPALRPFAAMLRELEAPDADEPLAASPLLTAPPDLARLYFQIWPDGRISSPQAPHGGLRGLALMSDCDPTRLAMAEGFLEELKAAYAGGVLPADLRPSADYRKALLRAETNLDRAEEDAARVPSQQFAGPDYQIRQQTAEWAKNVNEPSPQRASPQSAEAPSQRRAADAGSERRQVARGAYEVQSATSAKLAESGAGEAGRPNADRIDALSVESLRLGDEPQLGEGDSHLGRAVISSLASDPSPLMVGCSAPVSDAVLSAVSAEHKEVRDDAALGVARERVPVPAEPVSHVSTARRSEPQLYLYRSVGLENGRAWQGLWIDWPALRAQLLAAAEDLLPGCELELVAREQNSAPPESGYLLASIPARLVLPEGGSPGVAAAGSLSPTRIAVVVGWLAVLASAAAIGLVLHASVQLGERRGRFVSAVTHELRTPLTTFCLYSQMLADGIIRDEDSRAEYHRTLKAESRRLARIVESVLDYARLGRRREGILAEPVGADELLARVLPTLREHATAAGAEFVEELPDLRGVVCRAEVGAVERILTNLVDNAAKYGLGEDRRIHLLAEARPSTLALTVADHGPGVAPADRSRLFKPFQRGAAQESGATAGLGLGLAFARGLARDLGGDLRTVSLRGFGAAFELTLPIIRN